MSETFSIIASAPTKSIPILLINAADFPAWRKKQTKQRQAWLDAANFTGKGKSFCLIPGESGKPESVLCGLDGRPGIWSIAHLPAQLPAGTYRLEGSFAPETATHLALGWSLAGYQFTRYRKRAPYPARLALPQGADMAEVQALYNGISWARDLINTPANDMHPVALAKEAADFAKKHKGKLSVISGDALLAQNYPMIYTVGKASEMPPQLVDMRFGTKGPLVTLVGKGVCFDSGGLDIKSSGNMKLMKKDMGGAACTLALARAMVETRLPVRLRVLLPIVENAVSGNAMRPLDIVRSRKGITVEIGNTDAEGRLILCDALTEADSEKPDLLVDMATLTGAARVALGTDIPAFFTPDDALAEEVNRFSREMEDPLWRLPLWQPYRSMLDSACADLSNDPESGYGGAITAALFLKEFVEHTVSWLHIDLMAWNLSDRPGRPKGGEAMAVRALYALLKARYGK